MYNNANMQSVSSADIDARVRFIRKTYAHLTGAVVAFVAIVAGIFASGLADTMASFMLSGRYSWLIVLGAFMLVSTVANRWAMADGRENKAKQYMGLGLFVVAEAVIFTPLLFIAANMSDKTVIPSAAIVTLIVFAGLTVSVFMTKKDFSFLRTGLTIAGFAAIGLIVLSILFGFTLGVIFSVAMVVLASGYILYYTSNVLHHYGTNQHVAAALALFSALGLLFWYILQLFMFSRD